VTAWDAIVVGARCAGSPTAMLLAHRGYRVLVVDRATFPSDTLSTHVVHPPAVAALQRWGVLDRIVASGCPPIHTYRFDFGPLTLAGSPSSPGAPVAYCPRRTVLDQALVQAAADAGAEIRECFSVEEVVIEGGRVTGIRGHGADGATVHERARLVIGADGRSSLVARAVQAPRYHEKPPQQGGYYSYWSGLPTDGRFEIYIRERCGFAAAATNDGLTMVVGGWPFSDFEAGRKDHEHRFLAMFDAVPEFAERLRAARREARIVGSAVDNFFRVPYGPGWALVGDAGYNKDPITAQGILDSFLDAELLADAAHAALSGAQPYDDAMRAYQQARDQRALPMYELTCQLASLEPPPPEMQQLFGAIHGNQPAVDAFVRMNAGALSPPEFFALCHSFR
jgi:2-polyprenyl-6-methoxyphenol hydroxylase-like FAD-dependent oxidoreductase